MGNILRVLKATLEKPTQLNGHREISIIFYVKSQIHCECVRLD